MSLQNRSDTSDKNWIHRSVTGAVLVTAGRQRNIEIQDQNYDPQPNVVILRIIEIVRLRPHIEP
jgi:hypothetical protein